METVKVLIVDQDTPSISILENRLRALGHQVLAVTRFLNDAAAQVSLDPPQIIFVNAPSGWGTNICQTIEELNSFEIPIILVFDQFDRKKFEASSSQINCDLVSKPLIDEEVQTTIRFALYRQQTQREIREQEHQIRAILHSTGDGLITFDVHGKILHMNMVAEMLTGWQQGASKGKELPEVLKIIDDSNQSPIDIFELLRARLKTGPLSEFDITLISREGNTIPVRARISPMRDSTGNLKGGVIAFGNISELTRAIEQIRLHSHRAEVLLGIIAKLNSKLDLDDVLISLLHETTRIMEATGAVVVLLDNDGETYQVVATYSANDHLHRYKGLKFKLEKQEAFKLIDDEHPVRVFSNMLDPALRPYSDLLAKENISTLTLAELQYENHLLGAMFILSTGQSKEYTEDELGFLKGLADQASLAITNAQLFENVRDSRFRLQYLSQRLVEVQEAERRAMARELHDQIGQMLTGLQFSLESGKRKAPEAAKIIFDDAQEIVSDLIRQVRELSLRLLPSMLDDMGLFPTLQWHFEQYTNQTGIQVNFSQNRLEGKRLPQNIEITAYRIIQEGLTNAARYAQVKEVNVGILVEDSVVRLNISDAGKGFDPERTVISRKTFGLVGMRERTALVGGKLNIKSSPGKGTKLEAYLPLGNHVERRKYAR